MHQTDFRVWPNILDAKGQASELNQIDFPPVMIQLIERGNKMPDPVSDSITLDFFEIEFRKCNSIWKTLYMPLPFL